jgi:hypothetical protein
MGKQERRVDELRTNREISLSGCIKELCGMPRQTMNGIMKTLKFYSLPKNFSYSAVPMNYINS